MKVRRMIATSAASAALNFAWIGLTMACKRRAGLFPKDKSLVKSQESRYFPRPGEKNFKPGTVECKRERAPEEPERFLNILVNDLKIGEMQNWKAGVLLHPTFYDFEITYPDGHVHRLEYVIEAGHHLDERYGQLLDECNKFFKIK